MTDVVIVTPAWPELLEKGLVFCLLCAMACYIARVCFGMQQLVAATRAGAHESDEDDYSSDD